MKLFAKTIATLLGVLVLLPGCDVIDRTEPSTSISQEVALSNPAAVQGVRASMYDHFHEEVLSTDWLLGPSSQADNTYFRSSQTRHITLNLNELRAGVGSGGWNDDAPGNFWDAINDANLLINGINEGVLSEEEANRLEAEGRFIRALVMHHMARTFGYEPGMTPNSGPGSGFNLSIPIRTEPTTSLSDATSQPRATASEVYSQLVTDLETASDLFSSVGSEGAPFYPSEAAAQALLARVHLYQRNWGPANQAAQNALDLGADLAGPDELEAIFAEGSGGNPEAIFTIATDPSTESAGVNDAIAAYTSKEWMAQIPTQDLIDTYESGDARLDAWYGTCFNDITGSVPSGCDNVNADTLELQKYQGDKDVAADPYADDYIHLRAAEMVLIQAEARLITSGVSAAINRLNDLREQRNASELDPANFTEDSARDEILAERRRELVAEGHRYFDLKRLGRDIQKSAGKLDDPADDRTDDPVPFEDPRILDDIPPGQLEVDSELVQNPGFN
jgi:hypothetical protein